MKPKDILTGKEARDKLAAGAEKLAAAVTATLGPRSGNVAIEQPLPYLPIVAHDGVTVAKHIILKDPFENMGAMLLLDAAAKTNDTAGDGTTTATLLANTLIQEGKKLLEGGADEEHVIREKVNEMELREQLIEYGEKIVAQLDAMKKEISAKKDYQQIATISAQNPAIGKIVADVIEKVGKDGITMVEEDSGQEDTFELTEGMQFDNGFLSPYFVTDASRMITEYEDGYVLLTDYTLTNADQIVPIIEQVRKDSNKPLLIIANDVVGAALATMVNSKLKAGYKLVAVMAPEYADRRREMLDDLAILTGGEVITITTNKIEDTKISQLGRFRKIRVDFTDTTISPKSPDQDEINARIDSIKQQIAAETNEFRKERLQFRMAKLGQGVAIIKVTGSSEAERMEKKDRYVDSVQAVKAALEEGVIPGGGVALFEICKNMFPPDKVLTPIEALVGGMLAAPLVTIHDNAGVELKKEGYGKGKGLDVISKKWVNMYEAGIIDPVKVTKTAVKKAISVAAMILTTKVAVADHQEEEKK